MNHTSVKLKYSLKPLYPQVMSNRFAGIGVDHPSSLAYRRELARLIDIWRKESSEIRQSSLGRLKVLLRDCSPGAFANVSIITFHTIAVLLTRDASDTPPKPSWSRHPRYSEPLLNSILTLLHDCLIPHRILPPPAPSTFSALFAGTLHSTSDGPLETDDVDDSLERFGHDFESGLRNDDDTTVKDLTIHPPYLEILRAVFLKTPAHPHHLSLAYLIDQLNSISADEGSKALRLSALTVIAELSNVLDGPLLASFLPALVSTLTSLLSRSPKLHSSLAYAGLRTLHIILKRVFPVPASLELTQHDVVDPPKNLEHALHSLSLSEKHPEPSSSNAKPNNPSRTETLSGEGFKKEMQRRKSLRVQLDDAWLATTIRQIQPRLVSVAVSTTGARLHTQSGVRIGLVHFLSSLVSLKNITLLPEHVATFRYILLESCADSYPTVANAALRSMRHFSVTDIERALAACVHSIDNEPGTTTREQVPPVLKRELAVLKLIQSASDDQLRDRLCTGILAVLFPESGEKKSPLNPIVEPRRLPAILARVGYEPFAQMLVDLHKKCWRPTRVASEAVAKALENAVLKAAVVVGQIGLLSGVLDSLLCMTDSPGSNQAEPFESASDQSERNIPAFERRAHAALVLRAIVIGALQVAKDEGDVRLADDAAKEVLEAMGRVFVPSMEQATDKEASGLDDTVISLKLGLLQGLSNLVEELSKMRLRNKRRPVGSDVVVVFLMHTLRDAAHGEQVLRPEAVKSLTCVAKTVGVGSHRALIFRHVNYVLARIIRNMEQAWAADVLRLVVGTQADDLSHEAMLLLLRTLRGLSDGVAGFEDDRAAQTLHFMRSVLTAALAQQNETGTMIDSVERLVDELGNQRRAKRASDDLRAVHGAMMSYCLDDVNDEDGVPNDDDAAVADDFFEGFDEDEVADGEGKGVDPIDSVAESVLDGTRDLLSGRNWGLRATALECATLALRLLKLRKKALLPQVAQLLPLLPAQFDALTEELDAGERLARVALERQKNRGDLSAEKHLVISSVNSKGAELPVVRHACLLVSEAALHAGSFVKDRFVRLIFPKVRPLLRLVEWFPTLLMRQNGTRPDGIQDIIPSYGAMAACDACLQMLACIGMRVPNALAPFGSQLVTTIAGFITDSGAYMQARNQVNVAKERFEHERWIKRKKIATIIVSALTKACPDETFCALLKHDAQAPHELIPDRVFGIKLNPVPVR